MVFAGREVSKAFVTFLPTCKADVTIASSSGLDTGLGSKRQQAYTSSHTGTNTGTKHDSLCDDTNKPIPYSVTCDGGFARTRRCQSEGQVSVGRLSNVRWHHTNRRSAPIRSLTVTVSTTISISFSIVSHAGLILLTSGCAFFALGVT